MAISILDIPARNYFNIINYSMPDSDFGSSYYIKRLKDDLRELGKSNNFIDSVNSLLFLEADMMALCEELRKGRHATFGFVRPSTARSIDDLRNIMNQFDKCDLYGLIGFIQRMKEITHAEFQQILPALLNQKTVSQLSQDSDIVTDLDIDHIMFCNMMSRNSAHGIINFNNLVRYIPNDKLPLFFQYILDLNHPKQDTIFKNIVKRLRRNYDFKECDNPGMALGEIYAMAKLDHPNLSIKDFIHLHLKVHIITTVQDFGINASYGKELNAAILKVILDLDAENYKNPKPLEKAKGRFDMGNTILGLMGYGAPELQEDANYIKTKCNLIAPNTNTNTNTNGASQTNTSGSAAPTSSASTGGNKIDNILGVAVPIAGAVGIAGAAVVAAAATASVAGAGLGLCVAAAASSAVCNSAKEFMSDDTDVKNVAYAKIAASLVCAGLYVYKGAGLLGGLACFSAIWTFCGKLHDSIRHKDELAKTRARVNLGVSCIATAASALLLLLKLTLKSQVIYFITFCIASVIVDSYFLITDKFQKQDKDEEKDEKKNEQVNGNEAEQGVGKSVERV